MWQARPEWMESTLNHSLSFSLDFSLTHSTLFSADSNTACCSHACLPTHNRLFSAHATVALQWIEIRNYNLQTRFLKNWIVFAMSAVMHELVDWKLYPRCAYSRSLSWWLMQPMAFILEGVVGHCWRSSLARKGVSRSRAIMIFERVAGYCWVFAWMFWSVPKRAYPLIQCGG